MHDNKGHETPRLSVVCLSKGTCEEVIIKDKGRGLRTAMDLECLWTVDAKVTGKQQNYYMAMTSIGDAWMFKVGTCIAGERMGLGVNGASHAAWA